MWNISNQPSYADYQAWSIAPIGRRHQQHHREDYGELKRHEWEFPHHTAFAYGILTPHRQTELACVYINRSTQPGTEATVRLWVTKQGREAGLEPILHKVVREWVTAKWPFKAVTFPEAK